MDKQQAFTSSLFIMLTLVCLGNFAEVKYGAIYHPRDAVLYKSFEAGVKRLNEGGMLKPQQIKAVPFVTNGDDLMGCEAAEKLRDTSCIFDLSFGDDRSYTLAEVLGIPMVVLKPMLEGVRWSDYVFTLNPTEDAIAMAMVDLLHSFMEDKHGRVAILAERKRDHLGTRIFSVARQRERVIPYMMPEVVMGDNRETKQALTALLNSRINYVVLVCEPKDTRTIIEKAMRLGCVNRESKWVTPDMEIPGNISALALRGLVGMQLRATGTKRLIREAENNGPRSHVSGLTYALLNDSLYAVGMAMQQTLQSQINVEQTKSSCPIRSSVLTSKKSTILSFLSKVKMQGLTGPVSFKEGTNERSAEVFDIMNIQIRPESKSVDGVISQKYKRGTLSVTSRGTEVQKDADIILTGKYWEDIMCEFRGKEFMKPPSIMQRTITVTTKLDQPFMMYTKNHTTKMGNDRYEGFSKSLLDLLAAKLNFKYKIVISKETSWGSFTNGQWTGIIGEVVKKQADMCIGPITITAEREEVIDFSKPFLDFRIAMILQKPKGEEVNLFAFLLPFDEKLWLCTCGVVGLVTLFMWVLDRFSPNGYRAEAEATGEGDGTEFSLSNSLWFATGSILQQGGDNTPRSGSGRVLAAAFWLFTLILISTYTANLAAYFTAKSIKSKINSLEDLANQNTIKYGVQQGGSLYAFFENSKVPIYQQMFGNMNAWNSFVTSTTDGINRVRTSQFTYLTDQPSLDFYNSLQPCNTILIKNLLDAKSYALGLTRNSEWTNEISVAILQLREEGEVEKIRLRWWDDRSECPPEGAADSSSPQRLELHTLAGVFIILGGGAAISLALLLVENRCKDVFGAGRPQSPAEGARDDLDGLCRNPPSITINGGTELKLINNERRQEPDGKNRRSPRPDNAANRGRSTPGYDLRIPQVYASAPESNL